jgi:predicted DNA-binding transcriptional regulator AlpA
VVAKRLHEAAVEVVANEAAAKDRILRLPEAAQMIALAEQTMYALRARGEGPPSFKIGGRVVYRESAVREWLAEQEQAEQDRLHRLGVAG